MKCENILYVGGMDAREPGTSKKVALWPTATSAAIALGSGSRYMNLDQSNTRKF